MIQGLINCLVEIADEHGVIVELLQTLKKSRKWKRLNPKSPCSNSDNNDSDNDDSDNDNKDNDNSEKDDGDGDSDDDKSLQTTLKLVKCMKKDKH